MNILYLASANSVHDVKWMSFFSSMPDFRVFLISEQQDAPQSGSRQEALLAENNIKYAASIPPFSFLHPGRKSTAIAIIRRICALNSIDVVHALFATPNAMWALFSGRKYVITTRGSDVLHVIPQLKNPPVRRLYLRLLYGVYRKAFCGAGLITATSQTQKSAICNMFGPLRVELIRTGVDVAGLRQGQDTGMLPEELKGRKFVLSPRWINPLYNSILQGEAISGLPKDILRKYTFVFFKNFSTSPIYLKEFEERLSGISGLNYLILDAVSQPVMLNLVRASSLILMVPSRDGTPNAALEAMAAGIPLIVGNLDYDADLFDGTCIRLRDMSPAELSDAIILALTDYPAGLLQKAAAAVDAFGNRESEMGKMLNLYHQLSIR